VEELRTVFRDDFAASDLTGQLPVESRRGNKNILITNYRGYSHFTPQKSKSPSDYVRSFTEVAEWVQTQAPSDPTSRTEPDSTGPDRTGLDRTGLDRNEPDRNGLDRIGLEWTEPDRTRPDQTRPDRTVPTQLRCSPRLHPRLRSLAASASALITPPLIYYPAPSDLNLDRAGQPLTFSSATRGLHSKEWALADEQELIKLLVTLKCLLPVIRPAKTPVYIKRVVKEKWDEVNRLRKRRVRWTIGGDKTDVEYDVGTNTSALPTVNALFHSIFSTHSHLATIDIVDYYLGAILPSPESVRIDVSSISLPPLTKLGLLPVLRHSPNNKPFFIFCDVLKTVPGLLPQSRLLSQLRLVSLLTQHGYSETSTPMLFRHHTHSSTAFSLTVDDFLVRYSYPSELDHLVSCLSTLYELKVYRDSPRNLGYTIDYSPSSSTTRWLQVFSAGETGGDTVVEGGRDEGVAVWEAGDV
jgi:hypothetical protein